MSEFPKVSRGGGPRSNEPHEGGEYRCTVCAYGVATSTPPADCPMCGNGHWTYSRAGCASSTELWHRGSTVVLKPPPELDSAGRVLLTEVVAALAYDRPQIVVDLSEVAELGPDNIELIRRLAALAHGAGGRLLASPAPSA